MPDSPTQKIDRLDPDPAGSGNDRPRQYPVTDPENLLLEYQNSIEEISDLKYLISKLTKEKNDVYEGITDKALVTKLEDLQGIIDSLETQLKTRDQDFTDRNLEIESITQNLNNLQTDNLTLASQLNDSHKIIDSYKTTGHTPTQSQKNIQSSLHSKDEELALINSS
jgi:chromosome segregation ATPase